MSFQLFKSPLRLLTCTQSDINNNNNEKYNNNNNNNIFLVCLWGNLRSIGLRFGLWCESMCTSLLILATPIASPLLLLVFSTQTHRAEWQGQENIKTERETKSCQTHARTFSLQLHPFSKLTSCVCSHNESLKCHLRALTSIVKY